MATAFCDTNDELWREAASWLTHWEMLRPDHKANWPQAGIADLANILRDGVLLCKLLNRIDPGCIDLKDISLKPTMAQFLCLRNIHVFLRTCETAFGLSKNDLFDAAMLFDLTNFHKVLCTLSKLSLSPKSLNGNIAGFEAQKVKTREEEAIYQHLKTVEMSTKNESCDLSEEIYQDLCSTRSTVNALEQQQQTFEKRDFVIRELLDTEKNYVEVLHKLKKNFMTPLSTHLDTDCFEVVFFKIHELFTIHSSFYSELIKVRHDPPIKLSSVFMKYRDKFLVYGSYCANLTKATTTLQELCDNDETFNLTIIKYEKDDNNGRFKLRDVLSVPMQRILKYHLLLEKLIENTDPNAEEYNDLRRAREAMLDVAGYINEAARDSEHLAVISNLQENIVEWAPDPEMKLSDYGRLIKDGELRLRAHDEQKQRTRYFFIFEKCILICKQLRGHQFAFRNIINVMDYHVEDVHNRAILNGPKWAFMFHLVKNDNGMVYTVHVRTLELKDQIIKAINDALDNLRPPIRTTHSFELSTLPSPMACQHCSKYLKGLIYQGYKCLVCNIAVHKNCIPNSGRCGMPHVQSPSLQHSHSFLTNGNKNIDPLQEKLWFVGEMEHKVADQMLEQRENGTFMVRIRSQVEGDDKYALSLKTENTVKHMKICCSVDIQNNERKYYLSQCRYFSTIEELVLHYQEYSLKENFERLDENTKLLWPYKQLEAIAEHTFESNNSQELSFHEGDIIIIVGKDGYRENWWKGRSKHNDVGFFPRDRVKVDGLVNFEN